MSVRGTSPFQARYESEVKALAAACRNVMGGCSQLAGACDEAIAKGGQVRPDNHETTISVGYRQLIKTLGVVLFLQSTGAVIRPMQRVFGERA